MVPQIEPAAVDDPGENLRHADGQRGRAAGAAKQCFLADLAGQPVHLLDGHWKTERRHPGHGRRRLAFHVHAQIDARVQRARGDDGHDGHERFEAHRAVADGPRIALARDELGRCAAGDERVKARNRAARDGDEAERKDFSGHDQAGTVGELRQRGHFQIGQHQQNAEREREDRAEFHEGAEIIARREQQPHRQHAGRQAINNDRPCQRDVMQAEDL